MRKRFVNLGGMLALAGMLTLAWSSASAFAKPQRAIKGGPKAPKEGAPFTPPAKEIKPGDPVPVIACDEPVFDFGERWLGPELAHTFVIKNDGEAPLEITRVKPACGCTKAGSHPSSIAPGKTGEFSFKLNSKKLRGKYEKGVMIYTNDPRNPAFSVKLRGVIKRYVDVLPTNANFGKITGQEPQKRVIKITNNTDNPLEIEAKPTKEGGFEFNLVEIVKGKEYELHVEMKPPFEPGSARAYTFLHTNVKDQAKIRIGAAATIPERLDIQPKVFVMSGARAREYARPIRFTNYGSNLVKLLEATTNESALTLTINERTPGKSYTVRVDVPAGYESPESGGMITLKTDDPDKPIIEIPIKRQQSRVKTATNKRVRPTDALVGKPAPAFSLTSTDGKEISNGSLKGSVAILDFFAVNCGYCKKQIPRLERVRKDYEKRGVRFIAVSQTMRGRKYTDEQVKDKMDQLGFEGELATDPANTVGPLFKATGFPTLVVIGKTGKIEAFHVGNVGNLEAELMGELDALLAGKPIPKPTSVAKAKPKPGRPANALVGKASPSFSFETLDGKKFTSADLANHPATVLNFVAPNCGFCKKQIPRMTAIQKEYSAKGVQFVNVAQKMRKDYSADEVKAIFKDKLKSPMDLAHDPSNTVGRAFLATSFPTMVVLGKKNVEAVNIGNIGDLEARLKGQLDAIIAGKPVPQDAPKSAAAKPKTPRKRANDLIGKPAPTFTFETLEGKTFANADLSKHPATILNFVAPNCGYCKKQLPRMTPIQKEYVGKGVRFINVVQTMRKSYTVDEIKDVFLKKVGSPFELAHDPDNKIGKLFNARGFPTMVVLGKSGKVEAVNVGNIGDLESRVKGQLDALIAGKPVPVVAAKPSTPKAGKKRPSGSMIGKPAPKFSFETLDGKTFANADLGKHPATILNFVAPNCGYCKKQLPRLETIRKEYEAKGVRFINVAQTMRKKYETDEVKKVFDATGSKLELAHDPDNIIGGKFKASGFPTMVVLGRSGKVEAVNVGNIGDLETKVKGQLDALIAGKAIPAKFASKPRSKRSRRPALDLVGKPAPAFSLVTLDGKKFGSDDFANRSATVLNFVAPNCGYCKKQIPNVESIRSEYEAKGVRFINVALTMRKKYEPDAVRKVFDGIGSKLELAHDPDNKIGKLYKAVSFPTMIVVGKDGQIKNVNIGAKKDMSNLLKGQLDAIIKG